MTDSVTHAHKVWIFIFSHPVGSAEVHRLCEVVSLVEAAVISSGKGHHKLPCALIGPVHLNRAYTQSDRLQTHNTTTDCYIAGERSGRETYGDAVLHEDVGIHDGDQLMEEVGLRVEQLRRQFLHHGLQLLCGRGRHAVPRLRLTPGNVEKGINRRSTESH